MVVVVVAAAAAAVVVVIFMDNINISKISTVSNNERWRQEKAFPENMHLSL